MGQISLSLCSLADDVAQDKTGVSRRTSRFSPTLSKTFGSTQAEAETTPKPSVRPSSSKLKVKVYRGDTSTTQEFPSK